MVLKRDSGSTEGATTEIPHLMTDRLILRGPRASDFQAYQSFFADADGSAHYGGPLSPDRAWRVLAADIGHWILRGYGRWMVVERFTGQVVGGCGLWSPEGWPRPELTWWILPGARRRGFALEASRAAIDFAYAELGWNLVETHMMDENLAAVRLVERLGGRLLTREPFPDGISRKIYCFPRGNPEVRS